MCDVRRALIRPFPRDPPVLERSNPVYLAFWTNASHSAGVSSPSIWAMMGALVVSCFNTGYTFPSSGRQDCIL